MEFSSSSNMASNDLIMHPISCIHIVSPLAKPTTSHNPKLHVLSSFQHFFVIHRFNSFANRQFNKHISFDSVSIIKPVLEG